MLCTEGNLWFAMKYILLVVVVVVYWQKRGQRNRDTTRIAVKNKTGTIINKCVINQHYIILTIRGVKTNTNSFINWYNATTYITEAGHIFTFKELRDIRKGYRGGFRANVISERTWSLRGQKQITCSSVWIAPQAQSRFSRGILLQRQCCLSSKMSSKCLVCQPRAYLSTIQLCAILLLTKLQLTKLLLPS